MCSTFVILILGHLFLADDGWGKEKFVISNGTVTIRAWKCQVVIGEHSIAGDVHSHHTTHENNYVIKMDRNFDLDKNINVVQVIIVDH
jgi:hypothetical protein